MNKELKLAIMKNRLAKLENSPKCMGMGVLKALRREIRNLEKELAK